QAASAVKKWRLYSAIPPWPLKASVTSARTRRLARSDMVPLMPPRLGRPSALPRRRCQPRASESLSKLGYAYRAVATPLWEFQSRFLSAQSLWAVGACVDTLREDPSIAVLACPRPTPLDSAISHRPGERALRENAPC